MNLLHDRPRFYLFREIFNNTVSTTRIIANAEQVVIFLREVLMLSDTTKKRTNQR